MIKSTVSV